MEVKVSIRGPSKKTIKVFLLCALTLTVVVAGATIYIARRTRGLSDPFPATMRQQAGTQLYYPLHLPTGYHLAQKAIDQPEKGVTILTIEDTKGRKIFMSQEALPRTVSPDIFYRNFQKATKFSTPNGSAIVGTVEDKKRGQTQKLGSLTSNDKKKTWVLMNTSTSTPTDDLKFILQQLTPSK